ncbi:hypothetical protein AT959_10745 [Dechloromonas denitrificans]|uniref:DUF2917 domain-containing protein n=1 Tax=Dechloromonas denitrificans TaxID=281362 RepID=A0A133XJP0_9RHOO|nr:DUF2917 domain-containing protein [Dechloromonas denitrificans]KXB31153.1 hypothetical protein AT959_10745 [Dechloromonas denitrificans]
MKINLQSGEYELSDNTPIRLKNARGISVQCTAGTIWITLTGEAGDVFLQAGECWAIKSNGLALIESIGTGCIRLEKPARLTLANLGKSIKRLRQTTLAQIGNTQRQQRLS